MTTITKTNLVEQLEAIINERPNMPLGTSKKGYRDVRNAQKDALELLQIVKYSDSITADHLMQSLGNRRYQLINDVLQYNAGCVYGSKNIYAALALSSALNNAGINLPRLLANRIARRY